MSETTSEERFSTETEGLDEATSPEVIRLRGGDTHEITIKPVPKRINDAEARMLGYERIWLVQAVLMP